MRKDIVNFEKLIETYKIEVREILSNEGGKAKGKKKILTKKRCLNCYISIEKNDCTETCLDCKRVFHPSCILEHQCDTYKLDDGLSWVNGIE
jgi:hypothetical protein